MKTLRITLLVLIVIGIVLLFTQKMWVPKLVNRIIDNETPSSKPAEVASIKGCYVAKLGKDVYTLVILSQAGESFEGKLSFKNFEKDSSSGIFKGTYKNGILLGDYSFNSEGMKSVMQVIFKNSSTGFVRGYGEMNKNGNKFADLGKITYDTSYVFNATATCPIPMN